MTQLTKSFGKYTYTLITIGWLSLMTGCAHIETDTHMPLTVPDLSISEQLLPESISDPSSLSITQKSASVPAGLSESRQNFSFPQDKVVNTLLTELVDMVPFSNTTFPYDKVAQALIMALGNALPTETGSRRNNLLATTDHTFSYDKAANLLISSLEKTWAEEPDLLADLTQDNNNIRLNNYLRSQLMIAQARHFLGVPYKYGGTTPNGFDCSGLVYYAMQQVGIEVPRTAHDQYLNSKPIKQADLLAGDLVFFRTRRGTRRITHVGIYVGNDKFIHAPSTGKNIMISDISNSYYATRFVRGGRFIDYQTVSKQTG